MRILITGGQGQLGRALARTLSERGDGSAPHEFSAPSHAELDITAAAEVARAIRQTRPDVVINCSALTDTARCEREPELARKVNAEGAETVARMTAQAEACDGESILYVGISTNEVFDGEASKAYLEDEEPAPVNAYARSKLEGERLAAASGGCCAIVRTSWLYGDGERNFVAKVLAVARAGRPLRFVTDEVASPTSADDLAEAIISLIEQKESVGVYHLTNQAAASRYEWACEIMRLGGLDPALLQPVTTAELRAGGYDGPRKPPRSVLANKRAQALGVAMRPWREALAAHFERHAELRQGAREGAAPAHG
jgi:dTDP-4-dehydrorhamnose reductase